eukprot:scaffold24448_cov108-Cylindrotheca_fusiformis.AAC.1
MELYLSHEYTFEGQQLHPKATKARGKAKKNMHPLAGAPRISLNFRRSDLPDTDLPSRQNLMLVSNIIQNSWVSFAIVKILLPHHLQNPSMSGNSNTDPESVSSLLHSPKGILDFSLDSSLLTQESYSQEGVARRRF